MDNNNDKAAPKKKRDEDMMLVSGNLKYLPGMDNLIQQLSFCGTSTTTSASRLQATTKTLKNYMAYLKLFKIIVEEEYLTDWAKKELNERKNMNPKKIGSSVYNNAIFQQFSCSSFSPMSIGLPCSGQIGLGYNQISNQSLFNNWNDVPKTDDYKPKKKTKYDRNSEKYERSEYCVRIPSNCWDYVIAEFHKNWRCCNIPEKEMTQHMRGKYYYYYVCECQRLKFKDTKSSTDLIVIRFTVPSPTPNDNNYVYNVSYKMHLKTETAQHFVSQNNARFNLAGISTITNEDMNDDMMNKKKILINDINNDNTSEPIIDQHNTADVSDEYTLINAIEYKDNKKDKENRNDDTGSNNESNNESNNDYEHNLSEPESDDMAKLLVDKKTKNKLKFEGFFPINRKYADDSKEVQRLTNVNMKYFPRVFRTNSRHSITTIEKNIYFSNKLHDLIFDSEGKLDNNAVARDDKFSYINIEKVNSDFKEPDIRGMLKLKYSSNKSSLFYKIQETLQTHNLVNLDKEDIYDVSILIGGTAQQQPHFDNPRIYGCRRLKGFEGKNPASGDSYTYLHEINRALYNEDVMREDGPASMIFDVTNRKCGIKLGVLTYFLDINGNEATVKFGKKGETFPVVEHAKNTSIIDICGAGVIFAGDFPHFGVRNVDKSNKKLNDNMINLFEKLNEKDPDDKKGLVTILKSTPGLDELCRLFLKVKPKDNKFQLYELDGVGTIAKSVIDNKNYDYPM